MRTLTTPWLPALSVALLLGAGTARAQETPAEFGDRLLERARDLADSRALTLRHAFATSLARASAFAGEEPAPTSPLAIAFAREAERRDAEMYVDFLEGEALAQRLDQLAATAAKQAQALRDWDRRLAQQRDSDLPITARDEHELADRYAAFHGTLYEALLQSHASFSPPEATREFRKLANAASFLGSIALSAAIVYLIFDNLITDIAWVRNVATFFGAVGGYYDFGRHVARHYATISDRVLNLDPESALRYFADRLSQHGVPLPFESWERMGSAVSDLRRALDLRCEYLLK